MHLPSFLPFFPSTSTSTSTLLPQIGIAPQARQGAPSHDRTTHPPPPFLLFSLPLLRHRPSPLSASTPQSISTRSDHPLGSNWTPHSHHRRCTERPCQPPVHILLRAPLRPRRRAQWHACAHLPGRHRELLLLRRRDEAGKRLVHRLPWDRSSSGVERGIRWERAVHCWNRAAVGRHKLHGGAWLYDQGRRAAAQEVRSSGDGCGRCADCALCRAAREERWTAGGSCC